MALDTKPDTLNAGPTLPRNPTSHEAGEAAAVKTVLKAAAERTAAAKAAAAKAAAGTAATS